LELPDTSVPWQYFYSASAAEFTQLKRDKRLIGSGTAVTVVLVANDQMALGVMRILYEMCLEAPGDISIVGFDDIPRASYYTQPHNTVRRESLEVGTLSMAMLVRRLRGELDGPMKSVVEPDPVVRASTAPPR
jgi:DNA-binding LacI/PurR family transcriptional regulator